MFLTDFNQLTQTVNFHTLITDCDSHSCTLFNLLIYSDPSICPTVALAPLKNSVMVSISIDFPLNSKQGVSFLDNLRDVPSSKESLNLVLLQLLLNSVSGSSSGLMYIYPSS